MVLVLVCSGGFNVAGLADFGIILKRAPPLRLRARLLLVLGSWYCGASAMG